MRYTTRQRSVKRIFSFSSGTLNRLGIWGAVTRSSLDGPARLLDLGARGSGHGHALHDELTLQLAHAEQLHRMVGPADQSGAEQRVGRYLHALFEDREVSHIHDLGRLLERIGEAALGDAPDQWHLAALEPRPRLAARARRLSFAALARRLAEPRAGAAAHTPARRHRTARRFEVVQCELGLGLRRRGGLRFRF